MPRFVGCDRLRIGNYDPAGKRVAVVSPDAGTWTLYFYDIFGQRILTLPSTLLASSSLYFGSKLVLSDGVAVITDRLGSVRANSNNETFSYFPYGEERTPTANWRVKFGTYFRDYGNWDYADQRYYSATSGRFNTADPSGSKAANPGNPTSWNMYAYVGGDPVNHTDRRGLINESDSLECADDRWGGGGGGGDCDPLWFTDASSGGPCEDPCGGNSLFGTPGLTCFYPGPGAGGSRAGGPEPPKTHDCTGTARVLQGNAATIGHPGGFSGGSVGDILITASGAAIIPDQWGGSKAALRPYLNQISGVFPDAGASFNGIVDVVGGKSPCPNNNDVRSCLESLYPNDLIIELPGAAKDYGETNVVLTLPIAVPCPDHTHEQ